ncbi:MAG: hypothetical protein OXD31_16670 [Chloroflexi bacterium]|nr:hypothetical protein [Chloroflexota bacterium]
MVQPTIPVPPYPVRTPEDYVIWFVSALTGEDYFKIRQEAIEREQRERLEQERIDREKYERRWGEFIAALDRGSQAGLTDFVGDGGNVGVGGKLKLPSKIEYIQNYGTIQSNLVDQVWLGTSIVQKDANRVCYLKEQPGMSPLLYCLKILPSPSKKRK